MAYKYAGYLGTLLYSPDSASIERAESITIGHEQIADWSSTDDPREPEWQRVPCTCTPGEDSVILRGNFDRIRAIDSCGPEDPSFWVPLTTEGLGGLPFPLDTNRYSVLEIRYRCRTNGARPAWICTYPDGQHFEWLPPTDTWRTSAHLLQHRGFPAAIDGLTFRLYTVERSVEEMEIAWVRFRALTTAEKETRTKAEARVVQNYPPVQAELLEDFMPLGVSMCARQSRQMASAMEVQLRDYWRLALEDIARAHHNTVWLEDASELTHTEWTEIVGLAASFGLRLVPEFNWDYSEFSANGPYLLEKYVRPHASSDAILGWSLHKEPQEEHFELYCKARGMFHDADEQHPLVMFLREPNAYSLYARHFAASGMSFFKTGQPWQLGRTVRAHHHLNHGQQVWVNAPAFIYATSTPRWHSCPEMRLMLNHAFCNGARGWFSYCYNNSPVWVEGPFKRSLTGPFLTFSDLWSELSHRMERFYGLAGLFLGTRPAREAWVPGVNITWRAHPNTRVPEEVSPVQWSWLHGEDFGLLYIVNNDAHQVTGINIEIPDDIAYGQDVFDMTDFARQRVWKPMVRQRHIEMFPGQGQVLLFAPEQVSLRVREDMIERLVEDDRRQIGLDLGLARRYEMDIGPAQEFMKRTGLGDTMHDLREASQARAYLTNTIEGHHDLVSARSHLVSASAAICGCDGVLCRMYDQGRVDEAHEHGRHVLPLAKLLTDLRLKLRRGHATQIGEGCVQLSRDCIKLLGELRVLSPQ